MAHMVVASLTMALLTMATTGSIQVGKCGDLSPAFPGNCAADVCQFRCAVMGGDREKAYCDAATGKCCCPPGSVTLCRPLDGCRSRIPACRIKCKSVFRDPGRAFCQDGSPGFGDSCCCPPNNVEHP